ncbi:MAG: enoyl-CoA hydratase/isomerase family protein [Chloroflexi bacterium]|nr:enoyl-CoA hydratase/isomerase family protein [Chloroflexota bacterium]
MAFETLLTEKDAGVYAVTLNRPKSMNAISAQLVKDLNQVLDEMERDDSLVVLLVTGAPRSDGRPCFCAGADLKDLVEGGPLRLLEAEPDVLTQIESLYTEQGISAKGLRQTLRRIERLGKPTIAAIDGVCTGGGIELACCFDIRILSETAQVSDMHMKNIGRMGGGGVTPRLTRIVGPSWAKEMVYSSIPIDARKAVEIGFANHVYPPSEYLSRAKELAKVIASMNAKALRMAKVTIDATVDMDYQGALDYSYLAWTALLGETGGFRGAEEFSKRHQHP